MGPIEGFSVNLEQLQQQQLRSEPKPNVGEAGETFAAVFEGAIASANTRALEAQAASEAFATGARDDIHGTMLALSKADIELRLIGAARNKIMDAFHELWKMQV